MMWIGVCDSYGTSIDFAKFNFDYANYGSGWYYVAVGPYQSLYCVASGFNGSWANTNGYDSFRIYLTRPIDKGGSCAGGSTGPKC